MSNKIRVFTARLVRRADICVLQALQASLSITDEEIVYSKTEKICYKLIISNVIRIIIKNNVINGCCAEIH